MRIILEIDIQYDFIKGLRVKIPLLLLFRVPIRQNITGSRANLRHLPQPLLKIPPMCLQCHLRCSHILILSLQGNLETPQVFEKVS